MSAGKDSSPSAREAFGAFYEAYRLPLLACLRREGRSETEAHDLLHGFMEFLLARNRLGQFDGEGKFRSWLLACFRHFQSDVWDQRRAAKRGGAAVHLPLDGQPDSPSLQAVWPGRTPDQEYDRQFALQFLGHVMTRLREEYHARGKGGLYDQLQPFLLEKRTGRSHAELGRQLNLTESTVSQEISRLRKRYRERFDAELEALVGSRQELDEEKAYLLSALKS